jgi:hypothetical protein
MSMDNREKGFEWKFAHDQGSLFKANARRSRLIGLWAAEKMGLTGEAATDYAKTVVVADLEEAGDEDLFRKIRADFDQKKIAQSDHQIRHKMEELMAVALEQVKTE